MSADSLLARKPWLIIVGVFVLLILVWVVFLNIAFRNKPAEVPLETPPPAKHHMYGKETTDGQ